MSRSSFLIAILSILFQMVAQVISLMLRKSWNFTYQHKPTEVILLASSSGGWIHGCAVHILQPLCTCYHSLQRGTWMGLRNWKGLHVHLGLSTCILDPSGQCLHELIASTIDRGPQCPDDVLFSKWKSHSYVIKELRPINYGFFQVSSFMMR